MVMVDRILDSIEEMSQGQLIIELYYGDEIVPKQSEIHETDKGIIDATWTNSAYVMDRVPTAGLFNVVSGGLSAVQMHYWFKSGWGMEMYKKAFANMNVEVVYPCVYNPEDWCYTTKQLQTIDDLSGLKFRASGEPGLILQRLGVATVMMGGGEIYEAMKRGVIDAFEYTTAHAAWSNGFHEVADYVYLSTSRAPCDSTALFVNADRWAELPPYMQQMVREAVEAEDSRFYSASIIEDTTAQEKIKAAGVQILPLPKEIDDVYRQEAAKYYDEQAAKDPLYAEIIESQRRYKEICEMSGIY